MSIVAIYARYSSDLQSDASIEDQIRLCQERAKREGWKVINCYTDHAMSGASMMRPGIQMLMQDAASGRFNIVITEALDRLSRDQQDIAGIYKRMQFSDVRILTLSEGEISNLHIGLKGTMNAMFLKDLADKTRRGLSGRIEKGKSGGGLTYGYDVVRTVDHHGEAVRGERVINPEQARIVRRIFDDFLSGKSPKAIAVQLNREKVPCPAGEGWGPSTIYGNRQRGTGILNNELYVGRLVWNKLRYVKDPDTGNRVSRLNPEDQWMRAEVPELRIVDQGTWDRVKVKQGAIAEKNPGKFWDKRRPPHLFSYLLKCSSCGSGFSKISKHHYGCSAARNKGTCSNTATIRQDRLEAAVLHSLQNHLMDPELTRVFCEEYTRHLNELRIDHNSRTEGYKAELQKLERTKEAIVKAVIEGYNTPDMKDELNRGAARRADLERLIEATEEEPTLIHPNMAIRYRREVRRLIESLNNERHRSESCEVLRGLIEKIVLSPNEDGRGLTIDLFGDLAGILNVAAQPDKPLTDKDKLVVQGKLVAGARNPLLLQLFQATNLALQALENPAQVPSDREDCEGLARLPLAA